MRVIPRRLLLLAGIAAPVAPQVATSISAVDRPSGAVRKFAEVVPAGATTTRIRHGLGTTDVHVSLFERHTGRLVHSSVVLLDDDHVLLRFATAPKPGEFRLVCIG